MVFFVEARRSQLHGSLAVVGVVLTTHQPPNSSPQQVLVTSAVFSTPNDVPSAMHYFCTGHWSRAQKEQQEQGMEKESLLCVSVSYTVRIAFREGNLFWDSAPFLNSIKCDHCPLFHTLYSIRGSTFSARFGYPEYERYLPKEMRRIERMTKTVGRGMTKGCAYYYRVMALIGSLKL